MIHICLKILGSNSDADINTKAIAIEILRNHRGCFI